VATRLGRAYDFGVEACQRHRTLERSLREGYEVVDMVVQDEFTHNVVARTPEGERLVYDTA
jgi:hypothetical protein